MYQALLLNNPLCWGTLWGGELDTEISSVGTIFVHIQLNMNDIMLRGITTSIAHALCIGTIGPSEVRAPAGGERSGHY